MSNFWLSKNPCYNSKFYGKLGNYEFIIAFYGRTVTFLDEKLQTYYSRHTFLKTGSFKDYIVSVFVGFRMQNQRARKFG